MTYSIPSSPWQDTALCAALDHWLEPPEPQDWPEGEEPYTDPEPEEDDQ